MKHEVFWKNPSYKIGPVLKQAVSANVVIIGGGISGLSAAYFLWEKGVKDIVILERNIVGSGSTGHSAGMLVSDIETASWQNLIDMLGITEAQQYMKENVQMLQQISTIIQKHKIDCDPEWQDFLAIGEGFNWRMSELHDYKLRKELHIKSAILSPVQARNEIRLQHVKEVELLNKGLSVNPLAFAQGLADVLREQGVRIFEKTPVVNQKGKVIVTESGSVTSNFIIDASGVFQKDKNLENYVTTICISKPYHQNFWKAHHMSDKDMLVSDNNPDHDFYYSKITKDFRLLMGFGDIKTTSRNYDMSHKERHMHSIQKYADKIFGQEIDFEYGWSAPYSLSNKTLPILKIGTHTAMIGGAGTQVASAVNALRLVNQIYKRLMI